MKLTASMSATGTCLLLLGAAPMLGQVSGVSHPEELNDVISTTAPAAHYTKPSPAIALPATAQETPAPALHSRENLVPAAPVTEAAAVVLPAPLATAPVRRSDRELEVTDDPTSGVVTEVASAANELTPGTVLRAVLREGVSTKETRTGTVFTAVLSEDVLNHARILLPAGTVITGRVTEARGGRRIGGNAAIHLQPDTLTLPGATPVAFAAEVIDLDHFKDAHVNSEGTIMANEHTKGTLAALGLTTASATVAGAMMGGGVGAVVGAGVGISAGTVWWLKRDRQEVLPAGTAIVFSLDRSLLIAQ